MSFSAELDAFFHAQGLERDALTVPVPLTACTPSEAVTQHEALKALAGSAIFVLEDRWRTQREMMESRLLAHYRTFDQVYARNCEVRRIDKAAASLFLEQCHSYGDASCKYRYGLFLKRLTGEKGRSLDSGTMVAVAEFSSARRWQKGDRKISSCEWTRYASLPGVRVIGGMGKMLEHFIAEVHPDDVMSYADLEWSDGDAYRKLGFVLESEREPVLFRVDTSDWKRVPVKPEDVGAVVPEEGVRWYLNFGSRKYRLKLTDY